MATLVEKTMVNTSRAPRVCISILNWKNSSETVKCVHSLQKTTSIECDIVILDNESSPDSLKTLQEIQGIELIASTANLGFAGGHNRIMQWAIERNFDYIWLLNNDAICQEFCLERLIDYAEKNLNCALISPVLLDNVPPHAPQHVISILNDTKTGSREYGEISVAREMQNLHPDKVIIWGTALLVRLFAIKNLGFLDERLFAYAEDTDYALRSIACGYRNAVVFDAAVWHENPPHPRKPHYYYYTHRNSVAIVKKHATRLNTLRVIYWNLRLAKKQLNNSSINSTTKNSLKLGIWHGWLNKHGEYDKNERISAFGNSIVNLALYLA